MNMVEFSANRIEPKRLRCVTLVRVSTADQAGDDRGGVPSQRAFIQQVVARKGYQVVDAIELVDVSGSMIQHTPEIVELIRKIENGHIDVLVASDMTRLARPNDWNDLLLLDVCRRHRVLLDVGGTEADLDSPEGFLFGGLMALFGGHERKAIRKRMMAGQEQLRLSGKHPGGVVSLPLGIDYDRKNGCYIYTPEITKVIEAFRIVDEEGVRNLNEVARRVGINGGTVRHILRNQIYKGWRVYDTMRDLSVKVMGKNGRQGDRPKIPRPAERVIRIRAFSEDEQAIQEGRWERVQNILAAIRQKHSSIVTGRYIGSLLTGVGHCGFCGMTLYKRSRGQGPDGTRLPGYYICRSKHSTGSNGSHSFRCGQPSNREAELDALAEAFVLQFLADQDFVKAVLNQGRIKQASKVVGIDMGEAFRESLVDINKRDERIMMLMEKGAMTPEEGMQRRARLAEEREKQLSALTSHEMAKNAESELEGVAARIAKQVNGWPSKAETREKRKFLQTIFSEIYFRGRRISAFKLAPELIGEGPWRFATQMPVAIEPMVTFLDEPEVVPPPPGFRRCSKCQEIKTPEQFYPQRAACRACINRINVERQRQARKSKKHAGKSPVEQDHHLAEKSE